MGRNGILHTITLDMKKTFLTWIAVVTVALSAVAQTVYTMPYTEGFESGLGGWTTIDHNADGLTWNASPYGTNTITAHGGSGFIGNSSWASGVGAITPDDYLVSPPIVITSAAVLSWYERAANNNYCAEHYSVYLSTSGGNLSDFSSVPLFGATLTYSTVGLWARQEVDLSPYVGDTIRIAFRHHGCYDQWALLLDDVSIQTGSYRFAPPASLPYQTGFELGDDADWTFLNMHNGWYIDSAATPTGGRSLYVSADSGITHSHTTADIGFLWALRQLAFTDTGDYTVDYDWIGNGFAWGNYDHECLRLFLAPVGSNFDTNRFCNSVSGMTVKNNLPEGWVSLSDTGSNHFLRGATTWRHHAQTCHLSTAGTYYLVVLWCNHGVAPSDGSNTQPPAAVDNISIQRIACQNHVSNLRVSASDNMGLNVSWSDTVGVEWAVFANNHFYGNTSDTQFYLADPVVAAATGMDNLPVVGVANICSAGDTSIQTTLTAQWTDYQSDNNVLCYPFTLPYTEDFEACEQEENSLILCWRSRGGFLRHVDSTAGRSSSHALELKATSSYATHYVSPCFDAPANQLLVSFWVKMPASLYPDADTALHLEVGLQHHYEALSYPLQAYVTDMLTIQGGTSGWRHYSFATDTVSTTDTVGISFRLYVNSAPHNVTQMCYLDDIQVHLLGDSIGPEPPQVAVVGPNSVQVLADTVQFTADLLIGDTAGLVYSWHSSLTGQSLTDSSHSVPFTLVYTTLGTDTVTLTATNPYGTATEQHNVVVTDNLQLTILGDASVYTSDTLHYTALLMGGDTAAISYQWHSTMAAAGTATATPNGGTLTLVYTSTGTDTLTLTATNAYGPHIQRRVITVQSCTTITPPYSEGFEPYYWEDREVCWINRLRTGSSLYNNWRRRTNAAHNGTACYYSNGNSTNAPYDAWLIMPAIQLPDTHSAALKFFINVQYLDHFAVLASPTGDTYYDAFTDTLYLATYATTVNNRWDSITLPLTQFRGRRIRIAYVHSSASGSMSNVRIDDISLFGSTPDTTHTTPDTVWRTVGLSCADSSMGSVSLNGNTVGTAGYSVPDQTTILLIATPFEGYRFVGWVDGTGGLITSTLNPRTARIVSDTLFTAYFQPIPDPCPPITEIPWMETFDSLNMTTDTGCWILRCYTANRIGYHYWYRGAGGASSFNGSPYMRTNLPTDGVAADDWLISPRFALPSSLVRCTFNWARCSNSDSATCLIMVSPTGDDSVASFTDTLFVDSGSSDWTTHWASLAAYAGQTIRLAFHNISTGQPMVGNKFLAIDAVSITREPDTLWHTIRVSVATTDEGAPGTVEMSWQDGILPADQAVVPDSSLVTLTAIPHTPLSSDYHIEFVRWNDGDNANPRQVLVVSDTTFSAYFRLVQDSVVDTFSLTLFVNDSTMGHVSGAGRYPIGSSVYITAFPHQGHEFLYWNDGDSTNPRLVLLESDTAFTAHFSLIDDSVGIDSPHLSPFTLRLYPNPTAGDVVIAVDAEATVSIVDMQGRTILPPMRVLSSYTVNHTLLRSGAYFVRAVTPRGLVVQKLLVK